MSPHEPHSQHATITPPPADTEAVSPSDESRRRPPLSPHGVNTGVHWRPGPASAWNFLTDGAGAPVERTP
jgi:hypothetical protein